MKSVKGSVRGENLSAHSLISDKPFCDYPCPWKLVSFCTCNLPKWLICPCLSDVHPQPKVQQFGWQPDQTNQIFYNLPRIQIKLVFALQRWNLYRVSIYMDLLSMTDLTFQGEQHIGELPRMPFIAAGHFHELSMSQDHLLSPYTIKTSCQWASHRIFNVLKYHHCDCPTRTPPLSIHKEAMHFWLCGLLDFFLVAASSDNSLPIVLVLHDVHLCLNVEDRNMFWESLYSPQVHGCYLDQDIGCGAGWTDTKGWTSACYCWGWQFSVCICKIGSIIIIEQDWRSIWAEFSRIYSCLHEKSCERKPHCGEELWKMADQKISCEPLLMKDSWLWEET